MERVEVEAVEGVRLVVERRCEQEPDMGVAHLVGTSADALHDGATVSMVAEPSAIVIEVDIPHHSSPNTPAWFVNNTMQQLLLSLGFGIVGKSQDATNLRMVINCESECLSATTETLNLVVKSLYRRPLDSMRVLLFLTDDYQRPIGNDRVRYSGLKSFQLPTDDGRPKSDAHEPHSIVSQNVTLKENFKQYQKGINSWGNPWGVSIFLIAMISLVVVLYQNNTNGFRDKVDQQIGDLIIFIYVGFPLIVVGLLVYIALKISDNNK